MALVLLNGPTSPFGRMTKVVGLERELNVVETVIDVYNAEFLDRWNPLRQIPTLIVDDTIAIYDSRNICTYFDRLSTRPTLFPDADFDHLSRFSLALGTMEAGLQRRMEMIRPKGEKSAAVIEKLEVRIGRCLAHLEGLADEIAHDEIRMDQIATACALEYTDYRYSESWRDTCPKLATWIAEFSRRHSMLISRPNE